jgi:ankyrin repeat protein
VVRLLLKAYPEAAQVRNQLGDLPLHKSCEFQDFPDVVMMLLQAYSNATQEKDMAGRLPLHIACGYATSPDIVRMIVQAYPQAAEVRSNYGHLPLHIACNIPEPSAAIVKLLIEAYPYATKVQDYGGWLPLHLACSLGASLEVLHFLLETYPESLDIKENSGLKPFYHLKQSAEYKYGTEYVFLLHQAVIGGYSVLLVKLLLQAFPESCRKKDNDGMIPLHYVCESNRPHFIEYVMTLLDADNKDALSIQDDWGRTSMQLLTSAASKKDDNSRLPLHHLAACSKCLSEKSVQLLLDAYPESIRSADKYGMLPFYYACLNPSTSLEVLMLFIQFSPETIVSYKNPSE